MSSAYRCMELPGNISTQCFFMTSLQQAKGAIRDLTRAEEDMLTFGKVDSQGVRAKTCIRQRPEKPLIGHAGQSCGQGSSSFYLASRHEPEQKGKDGVYLIRLQPPFRPIPKVKLSIYSDLLKSVGRRAMNLSHTC